jgi:hypothetical protein
VGYLSTVPLAVALLALVIKPIWKDMRPFAYPAA